MLALRLITRICEDASPAMLDSIKSRIQTAQDKYNSATDEYTKHKYKANLESMKNILAHLSKD